MDQLLDVQTWIALITLIALEIVLGIDNIVFISILAGRLPLEKQSKARHVGLLAAMVTRVLLLFSISWVIGLTAPIFNVLNVDISGRDLILLAGGIFLIWKSTHEIHERLEGAEEKHIRARIAPTFTSVIFQIAVLDIIFSLDSVITAVGMANKLWIMIVAVVFAIAIMMFASDGISEFVNKHPTVKMLALSFLLLIGFSLIVESLHLHIPKGYIYFAMGFSVFVEMLNLRSRANREKAEPVHLHTSYPGS